MDKRQRRKDKREDLDKSQADSGQEVDKEEDNYSDYSDSDFIY